MGLKAAGPGARAWPTRLLHALLAAAVVHQLLVSLAMAEPGEEGAAARLARELGQAAPEPAGLGRLLFELHEAVGLAALAVALLYWGWILVRGRVPGETPVGALLPWFSAARRAALRQDLGRHLEALARGRLPEHRPGSPLPAAVHGLGLLAVSGSALTGATWWLAEGGLLPHLLGEAAEELHELCAALVWTYVAGHAGMALLHQLAGHEVLGGMFGRRGRAPSGERAG